MPAKAVGDAIQSPGGGGAPRSGSPRAPHHSPPLAVDLSIHRREFLGRAVAACSAALAIGPLSSSSSAAATSIDGELRQQSLAALGRAAQWLAAQQSDDGLWRSQAYGPFADGMSLTPWILRALLTAPPEIDTYESVVSANDALQLATLKMPQGASELTYPLYTAANMLPLLEHVSFYRCKCGVWDAPWAQVLLDLQLGEALGWQRDDAYFGGWGYAKQPPRKPADSTALSPLAESNLSATVFALDALRCVEQPIDEHVLAGARVFIERCQNFNDDESASDAAYDDGGFYFLHDDAVRNKAGKAGIDRHGRTRFASYGSTTADGLRGLLLCGAAADDRRVMAAHRWLVEHFNPSRHPGKYAPDREYARPSLYYYYHWSLARAWTMQGADLPKPADWATRLTAALLERQQADGAWRNPAVDVREDDPLVATPAAMGALAACMVQG